MNGEHLHEPRHCVIIMYTSNEKAYYSKLENYYFYLTFKKKSKTTILAVFVK